MNCTVQKYAKDGRCCDRCPAGQYVQDHCKETQKTKCAVCIHDSFTATENYLTSCQPCNKCIHTGGKIIKPCTAKEDTVCGCETGFYCDDYKCEHCHSLTSCPPGEGVTAQATRTTNLICHPCKEGTYSNITDFSSPCEPHTRCENLGRELQTPGTVTTDAVCGNFKTYPCPWMLPAGLWVGLVLTIIVAAAFIFWRVKFKPHRKASFGVSVTQKEVSPGPTPPPELLSHCQETCIENDCKLSLFTSDEPMISCSAEDTSCPITPLKASVSFAVSSHTNGSAKYITTNFCRSYSEPQEDEWCGAC